MRKIAILLVLVTLSFTVACGGGDTPADTTPTETAPAEQSMVIYQYRFNPNTLTVPAGTTVVFENKDPERHNVTIAALNVDQMIEPNSTWSYTFATTGEFAIENRLATNPMTATINVQ